MNLPHKLADVSDRIDNLSIEHLVIRADADARIGGGHVMRCLALAQEWRSHGGEVTFLSNCSNPDLLRWIESAGMDVVAIEESHPAPADLQTTRMVLQQRASQNSRGPWLAIDGYQFGADYQQALRTSGHRLVVIDDTAHLDYYHADFLINQNLYARTLNYRCGDDTTLLLGPEYAMLRDEFLAWANWKREIPELASRIVVTLGSGDADNVTLKVIQALQHAEVSDLQIRVIVGPTNEHLGRLRKAVATANNIQLLSDVRDMPGQFAWADLAVTAAGSTCWELALMGLPVVLIAVAENQAQIAKGLADDAFAVNLGSHDQVSAHDILAAVAELRQSQERRHQMSRKLRQLVDGKGASRIVQRLKSNGH